MLLGHRTSPGDGDMQHCISYLCFLKSFLQHFIAEWLTAPHLQSLCCPFMQVPYVRECPLEGLGNIRHLHEWGASSGVGAIICHMECITEFLDFFPVWGEHSVNHGWLCSGEDVCWVCGHRPLLHQSTMGLAQEWTPPR
jgi:hypothetical protein